MKTVSRSNLSAVILAAGFSSRMNTFKPLMPLGNKTMAEQAILSTTQRYLGKVSDTEAIHWIDNLYR